MPDIYQLTGRLTAGKKWRYGKTRAVMAFNFKKEDPDLYSVIIKIWPGVIDLYNDDLSFNNGRKNYLSDMNSNDKLVILCHADERGPEGINAIQLAILLRQAGLNRVGVIKMHACCIGRGVWMNDFKHHLLNKGISFAYLSGPRGIYRYYYGLRFAQGGYKILPGNLLQDFTGTRYTANNVDIY